MGQKISLELKKKFDLSNICVIQCNYEELVKKKLSGIEKNLSKQKLELSSTGVKGALSGLRQFLAAESPLEVMKNAFYFTSKALFILKIFKFLS